MAENVILFGKSGSGKSRSLINFGEDEITLFNVIGKRLPFRKKFRYSARVDDVDTIKVALQKMPTKTAVIDDAGYLMTTMFMKSHGKGDGYKLFNDIGDAIWGLFVFIRDKLPEDVIVYWIFHDEVNDAGDVKIRTIGKMLDRLVVIEGVVTVCLRCLVQNGKHVFATQSDGTDPVKSPEDMFQEEFIPNDLKYVDDTIREYWGIK